MFEIIDYLRVIGSFSASKRSTNTWVFCKVSLIPFVFFIILYFLLLIFACKTIISKLLQFAYGYLTYHKKEYTNTLARHFYLYMNFTINDAKSSYLPFKAYLRPKKLSEILSKFVLCANGHV